VYCDTVRCIRVRCVIIVLFRLKVGFVILLQYGKMAQRSTLKRSTPEPESFAFNLNPNDNDGNSENDTN